MGFWETWVNRQLEKGIFISVTKPWPEGPNRDINKEDDMNLFQKIKEMFTWNRIVKFLKIMFKGARGIVYAALIDLAVDAAKQVAEKGFPDDETKRREFAKIMTEKTKSKGYEVGASLLNQLREDAVAYIKNQ